MIRKYLIPVFAVLGILLAIHTVIVGNQPVPAAPAVVEPSRVPFTDYVAGSGVVETLTEDIQIGTTVPGIAREIYVKVGDTVKKGRPLFLIDDRDMQAQLLIKKAALQQALAIQHKLQQGTRPEEIPPAEAQVKADAASLADAQMELKRYQAVSDSRAVSDDDITHRLYAEQEAAAHLAQSQGQLDLLRAGTWQEDLNSAAADVAAAQADVESTQMLLDRLTVRAPVDGQLLQVKIHPGEYAPGGQLTTPLMVIGDISTLVVRTDVDENDAWRVNTNAKAIAYLRGNSGVHVDLNFERLEPYVIPKVSLTGDTTERVDTRVLQVLYTFQKGTNPIYVGQQMDVYIDAPPVTGGSDGGAR